MHPLSTDGAVLICLLIIVIMSRPVRQMSPEYHSIIVTRLQVGLSFVVSSLSQAPKFWRDAMLVTRHDVILVTSY